MITLHCSCCGHPLFGRTDTAILKRLQSSQKPVPAADLIAGLNISQAAWHMARNRINAKLQGVRIVNVEPAATKARYRLQKMED